MSVMHWSSSRANHYAPACGRKDAAVTVRLVEHVTCQDCLRVYDARERVLHAIEHLASGAMDNDTLHAISLLTRTLPVDAATVHAESVWDLA